MAFPPWRGTCARGGERGKSTMEGLAATWNHEDKQPCSYRNWGTNKLVRVNTKPQCCSSTAGSCCFVIFMYRAVHSHTHVWVCLCECTCVCLCMLGCQAEDSSEVTVVFSAFPQSLEAWRGSRNFSELNHQPEFSGQPESWTCPLHLLCLPLAAKANATWRRSPTPASSSPSTMRAGPPSCAPSTACWTAHPRSWLPRLCSWTTSVTEVGPLSPSFPPSMLCSVTCRRDGRFSLLQQH